MRVHATTGERPCALWEKENLTPFAAVTPYQICDRYERKVDAEGFVRVGRSRYSVPPEHIGKTVLVVQNGQKITVRCRDLIVAEHNKASQPGACVTQKEHLDALWKQSLAQPALPVPHVEMLPCQIVAVTPLSVYEEVAG